ncbi:hypothetical protein JHK82_019001 [Glycine max]|nr:hypothetical protein JHK85_019438 [Glycine max]KAG5143306.1 hypothetical protein JHK82_019001 [Glycine max]
MQQDGSARGDPGATDCGGLFQNKFAAYLACFTANLGVRNSLYEEIMGAILAIELVEHKGWRIGDASSCAVLRGVGLHLLSTEDRGQ